MRSLFISKKDLINLLFIAICFFFVNNSYAVTENDINFVRNKIINTEKNIEQQIQNDIERGIENKNNKFNVRERKTIEQNEKEIAENGSNCIVVKKINIINGSIIPPRVKKNINKKYHNKCVTAKNIEDMMSGLLNWLMKAGYSTTRVYLEEQNLSQGELNLRVQLGIVSKIIMDDKKNKSLYLPTLFPFVKGKVLNLSTIEQGIYQANKQRSNNATMNIIPGEKPGHSVVVIKNKKRFPVHMNLALDNHGAESTGQIQGAMTLTTDNLIGLNDVLTVTHREAINFLPVNRSGRSVSDSLALVIPFGKYTKTLSISKSRYASEVQAPSGATLISSGNNTSVSATIDRVMYRKLNTVASSYIKLNFNRSKNYLNDTYLEVSSTDRTEITIGTNVSTILYKNPFSFSLDYTRGVSLLGAEKNVPNIPSTFPINLFGKFTTNLSYSLPLSVISRKVRLSSNINAQYASNNLPSSQRMSIGSRYTVRGFTNNSLSGDNGGYFKNDIIWNNPIKTKIKGFSTSLKAGYDIGWVRNRYDENSSFDGILHGASIGLTTVWDKMVTSISYDFPVKKPDDLPLEKGQVWWRMSIDF